MKIRVFISRSLAVQARTIATPRHLILRRAWLWTGLGTGFLAFATIAFGPRPAQAAVTEAWVQRYGSGAGSTDYGCKVVTDAAGNFIVAGTSNQGSGSDMQVIKYSGAGVPLWTNRCNGSARAVAVGESGNVFVTGESFSNGGSSEYATIGYSGGGVPLWTNRYNGPVNGPDLATAVAVDGNGNVLVTGTSYGPSSNDDYYTAKYAAADGVLLWEKRYNGPANGYDRANALAVDGGGNVVVTGYSESSSSADYYTAKYAAADGALLWEKRYNGPANRIDWANAVAVDGSGNVVVTGRTDGFDGLLGFAGGDYYTAKYAAADGATLWEKRFNEPLSGDFPCDPSTYLALGPNGTIAVSGSSSCDFATVVYREVPAAVSIHLISAGARVRFSGISGRTYHIERAPAVTGPWSTINTQAAPGSGLFEYLDTNALAPAAIYRTSEP